MFVLSVVAFKLDFDFRCAGIGGAFLTGLPSVMQSTRYCMDTQHANKNTDDR